MMVISTTVAALGLLAAGMAALGALGMAAIDGDSAEPIASALTAIDRDNSRVEVHTVDVATGTGGAGTAAVTYDEAFADGTVFGFATPQTSGAIATVTAAGSSQATVDIASGPASTTVTVNLLVIGTDAGTV